MYGAGYTEKLLGQWLANRGVREEAVIIAKGAHSPLCYPDVIVVCGQPRNGFALGR